MCEKAKDLLKNKSKIVIECDELLKTNRERFIYEMQQKTKLEKIVFPMIFIDGVFLGNYINLLNFVCKYEYNDEFF